MIIKKFTAKTEEEALALAKAELGENLVVMNTKQTGKKGFFGLFKKAQVELTVAKEEETDRYMAQERRQKDEAEIRETFRQVAQAAGVEGAKKPAAQVQISDTGKALSEAAQSTVQPDSRKSTDALEEKLDSLSTMIEKQLQPTSQAKEDAPQEVPAESEEDAEMLRFVKLLYNTMLDNEVDEKVAGQIIDEMEKNMKPGAPFDQALASVYQRMILKFGKSTPITETEKKPKVVFFIGPTGVGKTTTIAKVASKFSVEDKKKVALLTTDTYRIAAAEQLHTYANILEVPFRVIYTADELEAAYTDFRAFDYIFVDTAGHSHQNVAQKEAMNVFLHALDGVAETEVHLVLSATTKYRDLVSIAETYMGMTEFKLIFTKLDETLMLGNLLNLKLYTGASISYVTCGQNVPDDIEVFNPQKTVKQLLGGK